MAQRHAEDIKLVEHGIKDDLGRSALRQAWESQPKDARGKSPADWWGQQVAALEAHRADPEAAPAPCFFCSLVREPNSIVIASAAAVLSSNKEALASSIPVKSQTTV